jgi:hypothetical protein
LFIDDMPPCHAARTHVASANRIAPIVRVTVARVFADLDSAPLQRAIDPLGAGPFAVRADVSRNAKTRRSRAASIASDVAPDRDRCPYGVRNASGEAIR